MIVGISFNITEGRSNEQKDDVPWDQVYQHTARSFVIVNYHLKKSDRPLDDDRSGSRYGSQDVLQRILNKNTVQMFGVIISSDGEVFTEEAYQYSPDIIDRITVTGQDGVEMPVRADRLLLKSPGKVLRIEGELPAEWKALDFVELGEVGTKTKLFAATLLRDEGHPIYIGPCRYRINWNNMAGQSDSLQIPNVNSVAIVCDEQGRPIGVVSHSQIDLDPTGPAWRGKDILADEGISAGQQKQLEEQLENDFVNNVYEIKVTFRPVPKEEEEFDYESRFSYRGYEPGGGSSRELNVYGLGFVEDKLLIPGALQKEQIEGIDTISVKIDEKQVPARFCGVLTQCNAMVLELQEGRLPQTTTFLADGKLPRFEPFWAVFVRELAGKNALVEHTRWINMEQAYADEWYPVSQRSIPVNSWLIDRQGRLIGLFCEARHEYDRIIQYLLGSQYNRFRGYRSSPNQMRRSKGPQLRYEYGSEDIRLYEGVQLADMLSELPANYDTRIRHLDKDQQRRRVWLGIEYTHLDKEMVKQMDLREQTQDSRIGLMVNRIYPGSPAARLGLAEGDVLLEIAVDGLPWPIELMPDKREDYEMPDFDEVDIPKEFEAMGLHMPRKRPWRSRDNYLTRMLDDIGVGTTVKLNYIKASKTVQKEFVVEQSPPDMLSAAKYKNDKLGLTVKDLTYEVRAALHLDEDNAAVVIAQVEQGKPAALARIELYELIRAVDGVQVNSVKSFEELITEAQQANKPSVRLTVEWIGKTRLADLKFEAKGASGVLKSLIPGL
jgi:hypothetical protein